MTKRFKKVLIANRAEIAARIIKAARGLGLQTVAVYSEADRGARHMRLADEAVFIGPSEVAESYLNVGRILNAAESSGAEAIHPGYGFLSENASFAQAVVDAGFVWIGPSPGAIEAMGEKAEAKRLAQESGVPLLPGFFSEEVPSEAKLVQEAQKIGFPLLLKATFGGGGRGIRLVEDLEALPQAIERAMSEAKGAFGSGKLMIERYLPAARHIEVQVLGDKYGHVIHLFERECSIQRRRQKVIEEAPSPSISEDLRTQMCQAAVQLAKQIGYEGAGTVEFLVQDDGFYFLEMNTRLQVEHPVTEEITGVDLAQWQIRIAQGERLSIKQEDLSARGHAIEARLYAEDDAYLPQTGLIQLWEPATAPWLRVEHGLNATQNISSFYDPMLAKYVVWGENRSKALDRLRWSLSESLILGIVCNKTRLMDIINHPDFDQGDFDVLWLERQEWATSNPPAQLEAVAAWLMLAPWGTGWFSRGNPRSFQILGERTWIFEQFGPELFNIESEGAQFELELKLRGDSELLCSALGVTQTIRYAWSGRRLWLQSSAAIHTWEKPDPLTLKEEEERSGIIRAPMLGKIVAVHAQRGTLVEKGDLLLVIEAMKMEHPVLAMASGAIEELHCVVGDQVLADQVLGQLADFE